MHKFVMQNNGMLRQRKWTDVIKFTPEYYISAETADKVLTRTYLYRKFYRKFGQTEYKATLEDPVMFAKYILELPWVNNMTDIQKAILRAFAHYPETLVICGSKGGKSTIAAIATLWRIYLLLQIDDPCVKYGLNPGTPIMNMNIGPKDDTARDIILAYIVGFAEQSWYLSDFIVTQRRNDLEFIDNIYARAQGSSAKAGRGYQIYTLLFDEYCFFLDTTGNQSGSECVSAFMPRLLPFKTDGRFMGMSTPAGRNGAAYEMFARGTPQEPYILQRLPTHGEEKYRAVFQAPTWVLNPLYPENHPFLVKEKQRDGWAYDREYGAMFADVVTPFLTIPQINGILKSMYLAPTDKQNRYVIMFDPSLKYDTFALAMGYLKADGKVSIPLVQKWTPPRNGECINMMEIEAYIDNLCERYNVIDIIGDERLVTPMIQRLNNKGKPARGIQFGANTDMEIYGCFYELVTNNGLEIQDEQNMREELHRLQRIVLNDRYRVQAGPGASDDLADCCAKICHRLKVEKRDGGSVLLF